MYILAAHEIGCSYLTKANANAAGLSDDLGLTDGG